MNQKQMETHACIIKLPWSVFCVQLWAFKKYLESRVKSARQRKDIPWNVHGEKGKKTALACLREGYPLDIPESFQGYPSLNPARAVFFSFFFTNIPTNIHRLALSLKGSTNRHNSALHSGLETDFGHST